MTISTLASGIFFISSFPTNFFTGSQPANISSGYFPNSFTAADLQGALVSPGTARCVQGLQENKLVFLCVQNDETASSDEAMKGVRDFKDSQESPEFVEVVKLDPTDSAEAGFLSDLQVSPDTENAVTVMMAPPGVAIGMIEGPTTKDVLTDLLSKAQSGCASGACGPGGCGPPQ